MRANLTCYDAKHNVLRLNFTLQMSVGAHQKSAKIAHFIEKFGIFESRKLLGNQNFSTFQQIQHAKMRQKALLILYY